MFFCFQRLDIRGRIKTLHGQNRKTEDPPLALFCICTPFGPPSLLEMPQKEVMFKSKHKLDFGIVSFDPRGREVSFFVLLRITCKAFTFKVQVSSKNKRTAQYKNPQNDFFYGKGMLLLIKIQQENIKKVTSLQHLTYSPFHKTLQKSSLQMHSDLGKVL